VPLLPAPFELPEPPLWLPPASALRSEEPAQQMAADAVATSDATRTATRNRGMIDFASK
jgi:hypothetical protein